MSFAKPPLSGDSGHLFAPVAVLILHFWNCQGHAVPSCHLLCSAKYFDASFPPSAVFLGAQRPNLLNSEKAGKEKGHIPDGANKGKAREVVGEGVLRVFWTGGLRRGRGLTDMNTMKWSDGRIQVEGCHAPFCLFVILLITSGLLCSCRTPASSINILLYAIS